MGLISHTLSVTLEMALLLGPSVGQSVQHFGLEGNILNCKLDCSVCLELKELVDLNLHGCCSGRCCCLLFFWFQIHIFATFYPMKV